MNKDADRWAVIDRCKTDEPDPNVRWGVRLPNIFHTACVGGSPIVIHNEPLTATQQIHIPVPPRKRSISLEAALEKNRMASLAATDEKGGVALSRVDSIASQRSMFDD
jgi:hypothetical protein